MVGDEQIWNSWMEAPRRVNDRGYIERYVPYHPFANDNWMLEHRLVYESFIKDYLDPKIDVVHHVNEIKSDNRIENLFRCTNHEHARIHKLGSKHRTSSRIKVRKLKQTWRYTRNAKGQF